MAATTATKGVEAIARFARPLRGESADYADLFTQIAKARVVLLGEATHGTREFYAERSRITQALIERFGFNAVAVEADWPDAYRVNRYVRGSPGDASASQALGGFARFPAWMWRNSDVRAFAEWLRARNDTLRDPAERAGFYGLDLYSLYASIDAVLHYLDRIDPAAAKRARDHYACFDRFGRDSERYAYAVGFGGTLSCEDDVVAELAAMHRRGAAGSESADGPSSDERFFAVQNARLVTNAERYYRTMFRGRVSSWNLRDRHMAETLEALDAHLSGKTPARIVVWAHNSHVGDARATEMGSHGEWTLGQLVRERYGHEAVLVGFTTHHGTVIAASEWGGPAERKRVRPSLPNSYEELFHRTVGGCFLLPLRNTEAVLDRPMLERAIGVVYLPETERASHYFSATLVHQFDAVVHLDETTALEPLDPLDETQAAESDEAAEAYPTGL